jgi:hypothetical protein
MISSPTTGASALVEHKLMEKYIDIYIYCYVSLTSFKYISSFLKFVLYRCTYICKDIVLNVC